MRGFYRWPVDSPHKRPVTWKTFPFDDIIMWKRGAVANSPIVLTSSNRHKFDFRFFILPVNNDLLPPGVNSEASKYINSIDQIVVISDWHIHRRTKMHIERWMHICPWAVMIKNCKHTPIMSQDGSIESDAFSIHNKRGIIIVFASI